MDSKRTIERRRRLTHHNAILFSLNKVRLSGTEVLSPCDCDHVTESHAINKLNYIDTLKYN